MQIWRARFFGYPQNEVEAGSQLAAFEHRGSVGECHGREQQKQACRQQCTKCHKTAFFLRGGNGAGAAVISSAG